MLSKKAANRAAPRALQRPTGCRGPTAQVVEAAMKGTAQENGQPGGPAASGALSLAIRGRIATDGWMPIKHRRRLAFPLAFPLPTANRGPEAAVDTMKN